MKKIYKNEILNIEYTDLFDNKFLFSVLDWKNKKQNIEIIYLSKFLEKRKNLDMFEKSKIKPATYSNVYSPKDELEIFIQIFEDAIKNSKKVHIVWITLWKEIEILEEYYKKLWFFSEEINAFKVDFSKVLVSASVKIENIMWRWSDYRAMGKKIFLNPPIRESWEVKNMFKWINRWVTAWIYCPHLASPEGEEYRDFLNKEIIEEHILPITMVKVLNYNLADSGFKADESEFIINY